MHVQKGVDPFDRFVRCIGLGPQTHVVLYNPSAPLHDRYTMEQNFISLEEESLLSDITLTINAFFGWDFNSCEALRKNTAAGAEWFPIDYANPCPDSQVTSLHYHFPWLVKSNIRWSLFCAATKRKMRKNLDWEPFYQAAATATEEGMTYRERIRSYAKIAEGAPRDRALRGLLRRAPVEPRRGDLAVLRQRRGADGRAKKGRGVVPASRGRAIHRAVLQSDSEMAR